MSIPFSRAPHIEGTGAALHSPNAPNAALLVDFDNVTMGMRSDLSKELKTLLASDVIRGKVTVQRAYADWRRYPQYIVPLSEASIDLIFAPAYGSSKKNATDIRMAIDGIELVFTRPEIGTYILLTGDSDFSSLVLKLKEYGKYVIGVGIQESSSDILVQNCDEYYSYTALSGLRKTDEDGGANPSDPWALVERAVEQMSRRGDVMRSDRLKQVMLEIDPNFDEKGIGFNKFSRFISEAGKKGLIQLQKMENGQYEIVAGKGAKKSEERKGPESSSGRRSERGRGDRGRSSAEGTRDGGAPAGGAERHATGATGDSATDRGSLSAAYTLLRRAISELLVDEESDAVRDSDVKRRMLALESGFDEANLGFPKFSRFLMQANDHEIVSLRKADSGNYEVSLGSKTAPPEGASPPGGARAKAASGADSPPGVSKLATGPSRGSAGVPSSPLLDAAALRLPTDPESVVQYLANSYGGVGKKTAETVVDALGDRLFVVLQTDPGKVEELLPPARAEKLLEGWRADLQRRRERFGEAKESGSSEASTAESSEDPGPVAAVASTAPSDLEGEPLSLLQPRLRRTRGGR